MRQAREKGVALLAVVTSIAILAIAVTEFSYQTNIDYAQAANTRDEMRAHFLARSGVNLARIVVKVQGSVVDRYRQQLAQLGQDDLQLADYLPMVMGAFAGGADEVGGLGAMVGLVDEEGDGFEGLGLKAGSFDVEMTTEDGKLNMTCAGGSAERQENLALVLTQMVAPKIYDPLFEGRGADGQITDRQTFVNALIDFVDRDEALYGSTGTAEEYGYQTLDDPYRARNNYLDSVEELRLVRGMDDAKWALFGNAFTVYGECLVNVSATSDITLLAAVIRAAAKDEADPVVTDPMRLYALAARVAEARSFGQSFAELQQFADYVKDPSAGLDALLGGGEDSQNPFTPTLDPNLVAQAQTLQVTGVELDMKKLEKVAKAGPRRTYRIRSTGRLGRVERTIEAVWDNETTNQNARDPAYARGTFVYWREY